MGGAAGSHDVAELEGMRLRLAETEVREAYIYIYNRDEERGCRYADEDWS